MIKKWLKLVCLCSGALFGVYIVFGLLMNGIELLNSQMIFRSFGYIGILATGLIGTVVHEFSHALMCLVFRHKIIEIAWFRPAGAMKDGVLGYVHHMYDPTNLYQQIGNFFIGIAPILLGSVVVMVLYRLMLPRSAKQFKEQMNGQLRNVGNGFKLGSIVTLFFKLMGSLLGSLFNKENVKKIRFWLFLFMTYSITSHMSLSMADLSGAMVGLGTMLGIIVVISFVLVVLRLPVSKCTRWLVRYNVFIMSIFSIGVSFSLLTLLISYLIQCIIP